MGFLFCAEGFYRVLGRQGVTQEAARPVAQHLPYNVLTFGSGVAKKIHATSADFLTCPGLTASDSTAVDWAEKTREQAWKASLVMQACWKHHPGEPSVGSVTGKSQRHHLGVFGSISARVS